MLNTIFNVENQDYHVKTKSKDTKFKSNWCQRKRLNSRKTLPDVAKKHSTRRKTCESPNAASRPSRPICDANCAAKDAGPTNCRNVCATLSATLRFSSPSRRRRPSTPITVPSPPGVWWAGRTRPIMHPPLLHRLIPSLLVSSTYCSDSQPFSAICTYWRPLHTT